MKTFLFRAGILTGISALFISCDLPRKPVDPMSIPVSIPARNELYVSGVDRLSLDEFAAIGEEYPKLSPQARVDLALDVQALAHRWKPHGDGNALRESTRCVYSLIAPKPSASDLKEVDALLSRAFGFSNRKELSTFLISVRSTRRVEWNPDLVREYGLQAKP